MRVQCFWSRFLVVCQLVFRVGAVNYLYEETVWTKHTWPDFKLSFPTQKVLETAARTTEFDTVSDLGPFSQSSYSDSFSGAVFAYEDTLPNEVMVLLAEMVSCKACRLLTNSTWQLAINYLHKDGYQMPEAMLVEHMQAMCEITVPRDLLKDWSISQSEGSMAGVELPPGLPPSVVQTFTLQSRQHHSVPSVYEHMAVQQACSQVLSNKTRSGKIAPALPKLLQLLNTGLQSYEALQQELLQEDTAQGRQPVVKPDGPQCLDLHEKCPFWASIGECEKNVNYMTGFTNEAGVYHDGHCRLSCGVCQLRVPPGLSLEAESALGSSSRKLQAEFSQAACIATGACTTPKLPSTAAGDQSGAAAVGRAAASAPAAGAPSPADGPADGSALAAGLHGMSTEAMQAATRVAGPRSIQHSLGTLGREPSPTPAPHLLIPAERHLAPALHDQCFYASRGWWSYEVCFMSHINQFHAEQNRLVESHSLGVYDYDSTTILGGEEPVPLEADDLLPGMSSAPLATSQHYNNGRRCDITEFNTRYHDIGETETLRCTRSHSCRRECQVYSRLSKSCFAELTSSGADLTLTITLLWLLSSTVCMDAGVQS